jgi:hypothetical protein
MTPEDQTKLQQHLQEIARILYQEADSQKLESLEGIEETIRKQTLEYITPQLGVSFSLKPQGQKREE